MLLAKVLQRKKLLQTQVNQLLLQGLVLKDNNPTKLKGKLSLKRRSLRVERPLMCQKMVELMN
ncbi:Bifunctional protein GlmU, partial [Bienertia sinuspersici]